MTEGTSDGKAAPGPGIDPFDRLHSAEVIHYIRDHLGALTNALRVVRLAANNDPRMLTALDMADRQSKCLTELADRLQDQARRGVRGPRKRTK
jgi:hypothetical protein